MILKKNTQEFENFLSEINRLKEHGLFFTDTHAHVHFDDLKNGHFLEDCITNSVKRIITIGIDLKDSKSALNFALKHKGIYAACGVHPHDSENFSVAQIEDFENLLKNEKVIAVGEIGLDYFRNLSPKDKQISTLLTFTDIALYHKKPIVIHNRDASKDIINILHNIIKDNFYGGIIHCFSGDKTLLKWALDRGFYISYAGPLTYSKADDLRDTVKYVPIDRVFIETDCPYLTPIPFRGVKNDPSFVIYTAYTLSKLTNTKIDILAEKLENNFKQLFGSLDNF
jgi:TatD DNase family protein